VNNRIGIRQLLFLQFSTITPTILIFLPGEVMNASGHGAIAVVLLALAAALLLDWALAWALVPFSPPRLFRQAWGPTVGRLLSLVYALFLSVGLVAIWAEFLILMRTPVLPLTPPWAVGILAALVAGVLVTTGPTGIARLNDLVVPAGVVVVALLVLASVLRVDPWNLLPLMPDPASLHWQAVWLPVSFLGEVPVAAIFLDRVRSPSLRQRRWALMGGALAAGGALLVAVVVSLGVLGPELVARLSYPFFEVVSEIRVGDFLTKNSLWLIVVGSLFLYVKLAVWAYAIAEGLRSALGRGARSLLAWGVVALTLAVALLRFTTVGGARALIWDGWAEVVFPSLVALTLLSGLARVPRQMAR
jgi:hypothetical protein